MAGFGLPPKYLLFNTEQTKNPVIVVKIAGINDLFTNRGLNTAILYGDPGVNYGTPGINYGGMKPYLKKLQNGQYASFRDYIELETSNPVIQQRLEPEQGRASVSTLSLSFVDIDGYMTQVVSPGVLIPEIMGCEVTVFLGYFETSYPLDFFQLFRGYVTNVDDGPGLITLQISDPNLKMRQQLFYCAQTALASDIGATDTIINVISNSNFFQQITGPDGSFYNKSIHTYIQIDNEWVEAVPIRQGSFGYSVFIQGLTYGTHSNYPIGISIKYIGGGTAGSELVTVVGQAITVQLQVGVSTAAQVAFAIAQNPSSNALVFTTVNLGSTLQTTQAATYIALTTYAAAVIKGILYIASPGHSTDVSITYTNTATVGNETVTVSGAAITVHIQAGATTAQNIINALQTYSSIVSPLASFTLLPNSAGNVQSAVTTTFLVNGISGAQFAVIARGARGTTADVHTAGASIAAGLQVGDSTYTENCIDMALKLMMSGWGGPWIKGVQIQSIGPFPDASPFITTTNFIQLPAGVDAQNDYGLVAGDYVILSGSATPSNNNTYFQIVRFAPLNGDANRLIFLNATLTKEPAVTTATAGFRSQYDVYPLDAGLKLTPKDVDITQHLYVRNTFLGGLGNDLRFFITAAESSGKDFISSQIYFPVGAYSLTRRGKLSCNYHSPPIANQSIVTLDSDNIIEPDKIKVSRSLNNRSFYDEIDLTYDYDDAGTPHSSTAILDAPSYDLIGVDSVLPIDARGVYSGYSATLLNNRALFFLLRYKRGVVTLNLTVDWEAGSVTEAGDIALVKDTNGILQIANFNTGQRGLGNQLFEITDRTFNIRQGNVNLKLIGNIGASIQDRFGVISPSSVVGVGSTSTQVIITDSFGALYPGDEEKKWVNYVGQQICVHSYDYSVTANVTLLSIDAANIYMLHVTDLGFVPGAGYIVDIIDYPTSVDPTVDAYQKLVHDFIDPTVSVATGIDQHNLTVSGGDIGKFHEGCPVRVHTVDYTSDSGDLLVVTISGNQLTLNGPMGYVPTSSSLIDLIGFADFSVPLNTGNPYRIL